MDHNGTPLLHPVASLRCYDGAYPAHRHEHAQVLIGLQGGLQVEVEGRAAFVDASCALVVPAGSRHAYEAETVSRVLVIDCPEAHGLERLRRFVPPPQWRDGARPLDAAAAIAALVDAPRRLPRRRIPLARLEQQIGAALHQRWTVAQMAALCHLSPARLHLRWLELTGLPPLAWVRQRRLDAAQRLLRQGWSLEAAALQVGYASASALAFALRRERGLGAKDLRRGA